MRTLVFLLILITVISCGSSSGNSDSRNYTPSPQVHVRCVAPERPNTESGACAATETLGSRFNPKVLTPLHTPVQIESLIFEYNKDIDDLFLVARNPLASLSWSGDTRATVKFELLSEFEILNLPKSESNILSVGNSFSITRTQDAIVIRAPDRSGLLFATDQLAATLRKNNGALKYQAIADAPELQVRALHLVFRFLNTSELKTLIDQARAARMNTIILELGDFVQFESRAVTPRKDAISKEDLRAIILYAQSNGLEVIPQVVLLTHQHKFFKDNFPELMYNNKTYDPRIPEVYELVFEHIEEVIELFHPKALHIGHDEVAGTYNLHKKSAIRSAGKILPPDLFLQDVQKIHEFLDQKNIETWMWGDMLISTEEFPEMHPSSLHGRFGYAEIRRHIPKDIVIGDWHYWQSAPDFPSAQAFADEGRTVLGASWKKHAPTRALTRYIGEMEHGARGMIATTWFHVPRKEWDIVENIISTSGSLFGTPDRFDLHRIYQFMNSIKLSSFLIDGKQSNTIMNWGTARAANP